MNPYNFLRSVLPILDLKSNVFIYSILYSLQPILSVQKDLYNRNKGKYRYDNKTMAKLGVKFYQVLGKLILIKNLPKCIIKELSSLEKDIPLSLFDKIFDFNAFYLN